ncbi:ParB N-terminal domain-containing protein [Acidianus sp. HS-5]|uniref:ParB N-terminal domain-containing protein n=1 Tax=Acidianus sp. HS-5 TaxID=2886040 RepID=UPI001F40D4E6|nr:ParB N-terminal domain-containing protein [Acidianus sp. HS-5]BDC19048.1 hypothetical protein HS5_19380 [Acidianus sp. HS-5]
MTAANITPEFIRINQITTHEDIDISNLAKVIKCIRKTKEINPIILDEETFMVIDGHHRFYAMKMLGFSKIPAYLINYRKDYVKVNKWFRKLVNDNDMNKIVSTIIPDNDGKICMNFLSKKLCSDSEYTLYWKLNVIEKYLSSIGINVIKNSKEGIEPPSLDKEYVLSIAKKGLRFPPKTTRHSYEFIIPNYRISLNEFV